MSDNQEQQEIDARYAEYIEIIFMDSSKKWHYWGKKTQKFEVIKKIYCEVLGGSLTSLRFLFNGRRINDEQTPEELEMCNKDVVEVYDKQIGGHAVFELLHSMKSV